ncbi:MAG TPA: hypothetical protein VLI04_12965, partial [Nocardioidaceae bacterium]|nr:hypothetical protein [Nocardioidaceae bacterium]
GSIAASRGEEWVSPGPEDLSGEGFDLNAHAWQLYAETVTHLIRQEPARAADRTMQAMEKLFEFSGIADDFPILWQEAVEIVLAAQEETALHRLLELARFDDEADHSISIGLRSHIERTRGLLAVRDGDVVTAEAAFRRAIGGYESWHSPRYRFRTEADLGVLLCGAGRVEEGLPLIEAARSFYTSIGATAWLAELEAKAVVAS